MELNLSKTYTFADYLNSVSYTHLRAHETVLDLVCRLLLEKKKNLIPHIIPSTKKLMRTKTTKVQI